MAAHTEECKQQIKPDTAKRKSPLLETTTLTNTEDYNLTQQRIQPQELVLITDRKVLSSYPEVSLYESVRLPRRRQLKSTGWTVYKEGYLLKKGSRVRNWNSRYFILVLSYNLQIGYISYYTRYEDHVNPPIGYKVTAALGGADLSDVTKFGEVTVIDKSYCFAIQTKNRTLLMQSGSIEEMYDWLEQLRWIIPLCKKAAIPKYLTIKNENNDMLDKIGVSFLIRKKDRLEWTEWTADFNIYDLRIKLKDISDHAKDEFENSNLITVARILSSARSEICTAIENHPWIIRHLDFLFLVKQFEEKVKIFDPNYNKNTTNTSSTTTTKMNIVSNDPDDNEDEIAFLM
jgi:hypothetical protein